MPTPCRSAGSVPVAGSGRGLRAARRRPPRLAPLPPLPAPVTTLDSGSEGAAAGTVSKLIETAVPSHLSIEALVELACRAQRGADWRAMYTLVHRQLVGMRLLPPHSDQLDPLRHMYQKVFTDLLMAAHRASQPGPLTDAPLLDAAPAEPSSPLLHPSRYRTEFEELSLLGSGGFAVVSRCRSLVDRQEYAVKRVPFRCRTTAAAERTLREVTVLASLDHPNIVKYNTAWLEAGGPRPTGSADGGGGDDSVGWTELVDEEMVSGASGGSLGSVSALTEGRSQLLATDSSTGFVVAWDRDPAVAETETEAKKAEESSSALSSQDSSSSVALVFSGTARGPRQAVDSSASRPSQTEPDTSTEPTASWNGSSAAAASLDSSAAGPGDAAAVLPSGSFGRRSPGGGGGRFWTSCGSSSGSVSDSSAARVPLARSQSAAAAPASAAAAVAAERSLSPYRRIVSAPAAGWLTLYIQMQPCERTLKDWLQDRNHGPPPAGGAEDRLARVDAAGCRRLLRDVLLGVHFIHQRGIIHRDLKPANIFLAFSGRAMIGDFGLARPRNAAAGSGGGGGLGGPPLAEQTGGVGTATYASPEQAAGGDYDQSTDLYSLGVVLYELFAPFNTAMERSGELRRLRHERRSAADVAARWPAVAETVLALTNDDRTLRPCAAHLLTSPLFSSAADRLLQLEAKAAHQGHLLEARAARGRQLAQQLDSCRHEAAVTERLLRGSCSQVCRQLAERTREVEQLRALLERHGIKPP